MNKPLISVIINCYNGEKYLNEAISSVVNQSYKNIEIIFWDNQSTDSSKTIVDSFDDGRIRYFYAKNFTKLYEARDLAIKESKGDFISFLDVDDFWDHKKLDTQIKYFDNSNTGIVCSNFNILNQKTKFVALGGINEFTVKKVSLLRCVGFSGISWIKKNGLTNIRPFLNDLSTN